MHIRQVGASLGGMRVKCTVPWSTSQAVHQGEEQGEKYKWGKNNKANHCRDRDSTKEDKYELNMTGPNLCMCKL